MKIVPITGTWDTLQIEPYTTKGVVLIHKTILHFYMLIFEDSSQQVYLWEQLWSQTVLEFFDLI